MKLKYNIEQYLNGDLLKNTKSNLDGTEESYSKVIQNEFVNNLFWKIQNVAGTLDRKNYDSKISDSEILKLAQVRVENLTETFKKISELKAVNEYKKDIGSLFFIKTIGNDFQEIAFSLNELGCDYEVTKRIGNSGMNDNLIQEIDAYYKDEVVNNLRHTLMIDDETDLDFDFISISPEQEETAVNLKTDKNLKLLNLCQDKSNNNIYTFVIEDSFAFDCHKDQIKDLISEKSIKEAKQLINSLSQFQGRGGQ